MGLIEKQIIDSIEVVETYHIQIRTATIIEKDDKEISRSYHRNVIAPGDDISNEDLKVQAIANAIWTKEIVKKYELSIQSQIDLSLIQDDSQAKLETK